ncbi:hypothetical protein GUJ93_ZPchr0002g25865 [Zizania palustris]|uniref:Uncharacterized protein n=1 Tax=Zizania palustris TaxID=103762 RepID=A0A8J5SDH8_ZIZPA|nr:hypothetical protein GUJ93_ZPchr0002g24967 [Zizania palustris]KAG8060967.1 hypothetical protein GUJ93_ZPchr0002g25865 [Zizania palustris]
MIKQAPNLGFMDNVNQYMLADDQARVQWQRSYGECDLAAVVANDQRSSALSLGMPPLQSQGSSNSSNALFGSSSSRHYWNDDDELPPLLEAFRLHLGLCNRTTSCWMTMMIS